MLRILLGILFLMIPHLARADDEKELVLDPSARSYLLSGQMMFFKYSQADACSTLEDVLPGGRCANRFRTITRGDINQGFQNNPYWLRFSVRNLLSKPTSWILELAREIDLVELYDPDAPGPGGDHLLARSGRRLPFGERKVQSASMAIPLLIEKDSRKTYYIRLAPNDSLSLNVILYTQLAFAELTGWQRTWDGTSYGILAAMILYGLLLFCVFLDDRPRPYFLLAYVFFQANFLCLELSLDQVFFQHVWPDRPSWAIKSEPLFTLTTVVSATWFARSFLGAHGLPRSSDWLLTFQAILGMLGIFVVLGSTPVPISVQEAIEFFVVMACLIGLGVGVRAWLQGNPNAKFFVAAMVSLLVAAIIAALIYLGFLPNLYLRSLPNVALAEYAPGVGACLETIFLCAGVTYRINRQRKEDQIRMRQQARLAALGSLAQGIGHEIGNPLNFAMMSGSDLARRLTKLTTVIPRLGAQTDANKDSDRKLAEQTLAAAQRQVEIVNDGHKRIQAIIELLNQYVRDPTLPPEPADLLAGIDATLKFMSGALEERKIEVIRHDASLPRVYCRPDEINQVFMNLLLNAYQAMPDGGRIEIRGRNLGAKIEIRISDTGPGVPPANKESIFDPFFTTRPPREGTGLGLFISQEIMRSHGGDLRLVDSSPGATFLMSLPVRPAERKEQ